MAPVQRVSDFMEQRATCGQLPSSSYRLGVRSALLHDLYSGEITQALQAALLRFNRQMPGFIGEHGLLHGVETRTSSPCSIGEAEQRLVLLQQMAYVDCMMDPCLCMRNRLSKMCFAAAERGEDLQSTSLRGLYPAGEGAGYAGGIVSAAVDGWKVGERIVQEAIAG